MYLYFVHGSTIRDHQVPWILEIGLAVRACDTMNQGAMWEFILQNISTKQKKGRVPSILSPSSHRVRAVHASLLLKDETDTEYQKHSAQQKHEDEGRAALQSGRTYTAMMCHPAQPLQKAPPTQDPKFCLNYLKVYIEFQKLFTSVRRDSSTLSDRWDLRGLCSN